VTEDEITANSWAKKAEEQYRRERYDESLISAEKATDLDYESANGWWFTGLNHEALNNNFEAFEAFQIVTTLSPDFANGWVRYGASLKFISGYDEKYEGIDVQKAFEHAIKLDENNVSALTALAGIYYKNDSKDSDEIDKEIRVLTRLDDKYWLTTNQLNQLGILHYNNKNFFDAIKYWSREIESPNTPSHILFNLGLAYNHPEISQDADAIDIWRLTISRFPNYEPASKAINNLLPRLKSLSMDALDIVETLLEPHQLYQYYINPFELLNYNEKRIEITSDFDVKKCQKLRKILLQEIELEDGLVSWMEHLHIDRSRAIGICDDLYNEEKREYHQSVFNNKPLLDFLSRGEHRHFTVNENWSPLETLEYIEKDEVFFRKWLSQAFTKQFDMVLTKSIEKENLAILEVLLDGRRWVEVSDKEKCFENAKRKIDNRLNKLRNVSKNAVDNKPTVNKINELLNEQSLIEMLNLFPTFFWDLQDEAVRIIRDIAVECYNSHTDAELSKNILDITKQFSFKSTESNHRIQKDIEAIENILHEERKYEAFLTSGDENWQITKKGVRKGNTFLPVESIVSVRWGILLTGDEYSPTNYDFLFVFKNTKGIQIKFQWNISKDIEKQEALNRKFIDAIFNYIFPEIVDKQEIKLNKGQTIYIGNCSSFCL